MISAASNRLNLADAEVYHFSQFYAQHKADELFRSLLKEIPWRQKTIKLFGREVLEPRLVSYHGTVAYSYSGKENELLTYTKTLIALKEDMQQLCEAEFNGVLCNLYRNGVDYMGKHSDNEKSLGKEPLIASVSLGAARRFDFMHKKSQEKVKLELGHGDVLIMAGATQDNWHHTLPKQLRVSSERINLTFRKVLS